MPAAVLLAVVVAEAAVFATRPRGGVIEPVPVSEHDYFSAAQIDRAVDYRRGQLLLFAGGVLAQGGLLVLLVLRPPRRLEELAQRAGRGRPVAAAAVLGAGLSVALQLAPLPFRAAAQQRAVDIGLSTQNWGAWLSDLAKSGLFTVGLTGIGAALFVWFMRRWPRRWWVAGSVLAVALAVLFTYLAPILLDPVFNKFTPLRAGRTRSTVFELARRAGVNVRQVYEVDASRRTTGANAYVTGIGHTKRVVLYDTLLKDFTPAEVKLVVAHELGHEHNQDVPKGILFVALITPAGMFLAQRLTEAFARRSGARPGTAAVLPALGLALAVVSFGGTVIGNQLSRRVEARADSFALGLTGEPRAAIALERRLAISNVADPDPPEPLVWLLGTHPPTVDRIGAAVAYERGRRP